MSMSIYTLFQTALVKRGVSEATVAAAIYDVKQMRASKSAKLDIQQEKKHDEWSVLKKDLKAERRSLQTNLNNRPGYILDAHKAYIEVVNRTLERIEQVEAHGKTIAEVMREVAQTNQARVLQGQQPLGTCGHHWMSWVPLHVQEDITRQFAKAYVSADHKKRKFVPFKNTVVDREDTNRLAALRETIARIRRTYDTSKLGTGETPYRALWLRAARMAEIQLYQRLKERKEGVSSAVMRPMPVNWQHLLDGPMRKRLKAAVADPGGVTLDGLKDFYDDSLQRAGVPGMNALQHLNESDAEQAPKTKTWLPDFEEEGGNDETENAA